MIYLLSSFVILSGVIKALGLQSKAVMASIVCLYFICLPLSYAIGFEPELLWKAEFLSHLRGINGLIAGFCFGLAVLNIVYFYLVWVVDWRTNSHQQLIELNVYCALPQLQGQTRQNPKSTI
jgi:Na+-driven multidrug efflux pump